MRRKGLILTNCRQDDVSRERMLAVSLWQAAKKAARHMVPNMIMPYHADLRCEPTVRAQSANVAIVCAIAAMQDALFGCAFRAPKDISLRGLRHTTCRTTRTHSQRCLHVEAGHAHAARLPGKSDAHILEFCALDTWCVCVCACMDG